MLITTYQKRATLKDQALRVCIDDTAIEHSTSEKLLGLIVDQNLTWNSHVKRVHLQTSRNIALLRRIKNFLPLESRILFYNSFIQPYLDYCSAVWDTCPNSTSLHKLQKRAARIILDKHYLEHSTPLFKKLNWIPLPLRFKYRTATLMFKVVNNSAPNYLMKLFKPVKHIQKRASRSTNLNNFYLPFPRIECFKSSFAYKAAKIWNDLPKDIKDTNVLENFKTKLYNFFVNQF